MTIILNLHANGGNDASNGGTYFTDINKSCQLFLDLI